MKADHNEDDVSVDRVVPGRLVASRDRSDGCLELLAPRFQGFWLGWFQRWLPPQRAYQRVVLDQTGSRVWALIDGTSDIGAIADSMEDGSDDRIDMVHRIWMFVRAMAAEGWLELRVPGHGE